jgi:hypothetical protein
MTLEHIRGLTISISGESSANRGRKEEESSGTQMRHWKKIAMTTAILASACATHLRAQSQDTMPGMNMPAENTRTAESAAILLMKQASGTSANPASVRTPMLEKKIGEWKLMLHGEGFISDVQQTGPLGAGKFFSTNWFMGMAEHELGGGTFEMRAMMSLEPATVTGRAYPELFQTGETAFGQQLVNGQHPHNLFMELSVAYAHKIHEKTTIEIYFAPVGDPALGPVAFPHRASADELPQAPLSHHLQDSTHISDEVITAAIFRPHWGLEVSGFHGAEPGENRWIIQTGAPDSWSARADWMPTKNWSAQFSAGRLTKPEALEVGDQVRTEASVSYNRPWESGHWTTSVIWGRVHKTAAQRNLNSYLVESVVQFRKKNYVTGRAELVDRDELLADNMQVQQQLAATVGTTFRVGAFTAGYTRDIHILPHVLTGLGANATLYRVPGVIQPYYGASPAAFYVFLRFRLEGRGGGMGH